MKGVFTAPHQQIPPTQSIKKTSIYNVRYMQATRGDFLGSFHIDHKMLNKKEMTYKMWYFFLDME